MATDSLLRLKKLIDGLRPQEQKNLRKLLGAYSSAGENKSLKLFDQLRKDPAPNGEKLRKRLGQSSGSFKKMIERLRNRALEALLLDVNLDPKEAYSPFARETIRCKKRLLEARIMLGRGLDEEYYQIMETVVEKGRKYELYDELVQALDSLKNEKALRQGKKIMEQYWEDLEFYEKCRQYRMKAREWAFRYYAEQVDFKGQNNQKVGLLTEAIAELQQYHRETGSAYIAEKLYNLRMAYYEVIGDLDLCCETAMAIVRLIEKEPAVHTEQKLSGAYADLADNEMFACRFEEAVEHARKAREFVSPENYNSLLALEMEFRGCYYLGWLEKAEHVAEELLRLSPSEGTPFQSSRRQYLKACLLFLKGEHRKSFSLLQQLQPIEEDKEGWNIGIRLLSILNLYERAYLDTADTYIESLRKHIERIGEEEPVRERDQMILKILRQWEHQSFDLETTWETCLEEFELLDSSDPAFRWEIDTPELIVFHHWFRDKLEGKPYSFRVPQAAYDKATYKPDPAKVEVVKEA